MEFERFANMMGFSYTLAQLSDLDLETMGNIAQDRRRTPDSLAHDQQERNYQIFANTIENLESIYNLIRLGILFDRTGERTGAVIAPFVSVSLFGCEFTKYILQD